MTDRSVNLHSSAAPTGSAGSRLTVFECYVDAGDGGVASEIVLGQVRYYAPGRVP